MPVLVSAFEVSEISFETADSGADLRGSGFSIAGRSITIPFQLTDAGCERLRKLLGWASVEELDPFFMPGGMPAADELDARQD